MSRGDVNVVVISGGLGNQLFQYAFGRWLEQVTGRQTRYNIAWFRHRPSYFSLSRLGITEDWGRLPIPSPESKFHLLGKLARGVLWGSKTVRQDRLLRSEVPVVDRAWYYGFWQFPDIALTEVAQIRDEIESRWQNIPRSELVVHIRQGDYQQHPSVLGPDYYSRALARTMSDLGGRPVVTVVTDDRAWCEDNLPREYEYSYCEGNAPEEDFMILCRARNKLLSGSTFSWWAAQLSTASGVVVAPEPFTMGSGPSLSSPRWTTVPRSTV